MTHPNKSNTFLQHIIRRKKCSSASKELRNLNPFATQRFYLVLLKTHWYYSLIIFERKTILFLICPECVCKTKSQVAILGGELHRTTLAWYSSQVLNKCSLPTVAHKIILNLVIQFLFLEPLFCFLLPIGIQFTVLNILCHWSKKEGNGKQAHISFSPCSSSAPLLDGDSTRGLHVLGALCLQQWGKGSLVHHRKDCIAIVISLFFPGFSARMSLKEPVCYTPSRLHERRGWGKKKMEGHFKAAARHSITIKTNPKPSWRFKGWSKGWKTWIARIISTQDTYPGT